MYQLSIWRTFVLSSFFYLALVVGLSACKKSSKSPKNNRNVPVRPEVIRIELSPAQKSNPKKGKQKKPKQVHTANKASVITESKLAQLRKISGVLKVFGKISLQVPAAAIVPIPKKMQRGQGSALYTDLQLYTLFPQPLPKTDNGHKAFGELPKGPLADKQEIPALISPTLLKKLNQQFGKQLRLPKIGIKELRKYTFKLYTGRSSRMPKPHKKGIRGFRCRIVGLSKYVETFGVTIPLPYARLLHQFYNGKKAPLHFQSALVELKFSAFAELRKQGQKLGLLHKTSAKKKQK